MNEQIELKDIQNILFGILCDFVDFLEANNLKYFLCGGTLLGAVRHKGFIPWDDDIDIMIPREDFDKLLKMAEDNNLIGLNKKLTVGYPGQYGYSFPFIKIFDKRYKAKDAFYNDNINKDYYVNIDVFSLDHLPENKLMKYLIIETMNKATHLINVNNINIERTTSSNIYWTFKKFLLKLFGGERKFALKIMNFTRKINNMNKNSRMLSNVSWPRDQRDYYPIGSIGKLRDYEFCSRLFKGPEDYDAYLTNFYGDYMTLPPLEKRHNHNLTVYKIYA